MEPRYPDRDERIPNPVDWGGVTIPADPGPEEDLPPAHQFCDCGQCGCIPILRQPDGSMAPKGPDDHYDCRDRDIGGVDDE